MKKKVFLGLLLVNSFFVNVANAQNIENAKKMFFYERFNTAKLELEKLVATSPNNVDANYWLVQTLLQLGEKNTARSIASAALSATNNAPILQVAMGQVELFEGKKAEARIKFEAAISAADKKTKASVLNAIGRANGNVGISNSEPNYAIEKLTEAAKLDSKNPDIYINMGDCYRRLLDGGGAVKSYTNAIALDANSALAYYRIGKVYQTQDNCVPTQTNYIKATSIDPNFMAAWRELFDLFGDAESKCYDIEQAKNYLAKYTATTDPGIETDKVKMRFCYYISDFKCAISEIDNIFSKYGENADVDLYRFKANVQSAMKDTVNAKATYETYFKKEDPTKINYRIYLRAGDLFSKIPGSELQAVDYYTKSINAQPDPKMNLFSFAKIASTYDKLKDFKNAAVWYNKIIETKESPAATDYFYGTLSYYRAGNYVEGARIGNLYNEKFPTDFRGSFWAARNNAQIDTNMTEGLAIPNYEKYVTIAEADLVKNKSGLIEATKYLFIYYINTKKDNITAKTYLDKLKIVDPTDSEIVNFEAMLNGTRPPAPKPAPIPPATPTKPAGGTVAPPAKPTGGSSAPAPKPATTPNKGTGTSVKPGIAPTKNISTTTPKPLVKTAPTPKKTRTVKN